MNKTNKIIYTQDLPGERAWLAKKFPDFQNLETEFSGQWPSIPFSALENTIWEIPPDSHIDVSNIECDKYKSLYQIDTKFISNRWCDSNLLLHKLNFNPQPRAKKAQVLTFGRCGTVFLESIIYNRCGYDKDRGWNKLDPATDHVFLGGNDTVILTNLIEKSQPDIFLCFRKDWWAWTTSILIMKNFGRGFHYYHNVLWEELQPFEILSEDLVELANMVRANWQNLCHLRTNFPHLNFYIIEFSELIENSNLTNHQRVNYNKKNLIANYDQAQILFDTTYFSKFYQWQHNCLSHLQTMNCQTITNFNKFTGTDRM